MARCRWQQCSMQMRQALQHYSEIQASEHSAALAGGLLETWSQLCYWGAPAFQMWVQRKPWRQSMDKSSIAHGNTSRTMSCISVNEKVSAEARASPSWPAATPTWPVKSAMLPKRCCPPALQKRQSERSQHPPPAVKVQRFVEVSQPQAVRIPALHARQLSHQ
jgi:hypothetical protein